MTTLEFNTELHDIGICEAKIHRIFTYCPKQQFINYVYKNNSDIIGRCFQHQRPALTTTRDEIQIENGFVPNYQLQQSRKPIRYLHVENVCFRVLRQGIFLANVTETPTTINDLIEVDKPKVLNDFQDQSLKQAIELFTGDTLSDIQGYSKYIYDTCVHLDESKYHGYRITELVFDTEDHFRSAFRDQDGDYTTDLQGLSLYCLALNYKLDDLHADYSDLIRSLNKEALQDYLFSNNGHLILRNLLQSHHTFIAFGRRGTVIAYVRNKYHERARVSAIIMIEILRARMHNMIVSQVLIDDAIRKLAMLAFNGKEDPYQQARENILRKMMQAHDVYGLVVSDPGAYLLDGSVLSKMADLADDYFHLRSLKENVERKMNALQRFWTEYQDQNREKIIANFVGPGSSRTPDTTG